MTSELEIDQAFADVHASPVSPVSPECPVYPDTPGCVLDDVRTWLARVEALPGFVGMPRTVAGLQTTA